MFCQKVCQKTIGGNIKRNTQTHISAPLKHTARQLVSSRHIKLRQDVTRWKRHLIQLARVPCTHYHPARRALKRVFQAFYNLRQLVNSFTLIVVITGCIRRIEMAPLVPVHRTQIILRKCVNPRLSKNSRDALSFQIATPSFCKFSLFVSPLRNQSSSFRHVFHATRFVVSSGIVPFSSEKCIAAPNMLLLAHFDLLPKSLLLKYRLLNLNIDTLRFFYQFVGQCPYFFTQHFTIYYILI